MAVEVTTASGVRLDIITQGKFQPTYFGNFDLDSSKEDAATGETSFGSYDVYWMPINDGLISNWIYFRYSIGSRAEHCLGLYGIAI